VPSRVCGVGRIVRESARVAFATPALAVHERATPPTRRRFWLF
jgi:hypothetical protein